jgi:hypothetical protein
LVFSGVPCPSCFLGHYLDAANIAPDVLHSFALLLPSIPAASFQGVFWINVEEDPSFNAMRFVAAC